MDCVVVRGAIQLNALARASLQAGLSSCCWTARSAQAQAYIFQDILGVIVQGCWATDALSIAVVTTKWTQEHCRNPCPQGGKAVQLTERINDLDFVPRGHVIDWMGCRITVCSVA